MYSLEGLLSGAVIYVSDNVKLILEMTSALITNTNSPRDYFHQDVDHTVIAVVLDERTRQPSLAVVFPD